MHNPYTSGAVDDMDMYIYHPNPGDPDGHNYSQIELELDGGYSANWDFKGQPQKINKVLRIKYRAAVRNTDEYGKQSGDVKYWMTAYMLIGFEDGAG